MPTKITFIYDNPADPTAFEAAYADGHVDLARRLPGVRRMEESKVWPKEDGTSTPAYRMLDLYFDDYQAASAAVATPEARGLVQSALGLATGGVRVVFCDVHDV